MKSLVGNEYMYYCRAFVLVFSYMEVPEILAKNKTYRTQHLQYGYGLSPISLFT